MFIYGDITVGSVDNVRGATEIPVGSSFDFIPIFLCAFIIDGIEDVGISERRRLNFHNAQWYIDLLKLVSVIKCISTDYRYASVRRNNGGVTSLYERF